MIARRGPNASMEELAAEAGITKPVLYRYFGDRAGLYKSLADAWSKQIVQSTSATLDRTWPVVDQIRFLVRAYVDQATEETNLFLTLLAEPTLNHTVTIGLSDPLVDLLVPSMAPALESNGRTVESSLPLLIGALGIVNNLMTWWFLSKPCTEDELVDMIVDQVWNGVGRWLERPGALASSTSMASAVDS
jgi:AcrR family transcriptional regulator